MTKVYIVQVQGWGDSEDEFVNISAHSTQALAEAAAIALSAEALADGLEDVVTNIEAMQIVD